METVRLYKVDCMLLFHEELICDVMPNTKGIMDWTTNLDEAMKTYEAIKFEYFDRKEVAMARLKGLGNTYNKSILVCDMPKWLFEDCQESELGEKYTYEQVKEYLSDCVFHEDCVLGKEMIKDELFEVTMSGIENIRTYEEIEA